MGKKKLSLYEKKQCRNVVVLALMQLVIILLFVTAFGECRQIDAKDTKQIEITVDDVYKSNGWNHSTWLIVISDTSEYLFAPRSTSKEYSPAQMYKLISKGSKLSLMYYEEQGVFRSGNVVVDARGENETYRTIEEYNRGRQNGQIFLAVIFFVIEISFVCILSLYVWLNYNTLKDVCRKFKHKRKRV